MHRALGPPLRVKGARGDVGAGGGFGVEAAPNPVSILELARETGTHITTQ